MKNGGGGNRALCPAEQAKFTELYSRYAKLVQAYCTRRLARSVVADAVADTFLVAWRRLDQIGDVDTALPWLYGTAYRVVSDYWRSSARARNAMPRLVDVSDGSPTETTVIGREDRDLALLALSRLDAVDREILLLELWEGLSHADVAEALGIKPQAARQRAYRARRNLAAEYAKVTGATRPSLLKRVVSHAS
jgi:RNA polymerase sigma-70 factor (ECF subfamily)